MTKQKTLTITWKIWQSIELLEITTHSLTLRGSYGLEIITNHAFKFGIHLLHDNTLDFYTF